MLRKSKIKNKLEEIDIYKRTENKKESDLLPQERFTLTLSSLVTTATLKHFLHTMLSAWVLAAHHRRRLFERHLALWSRKPLPPSSLLSCTLLQG